MTVAIVLVSQYYILILAPVSPPETSPSIHPATRWIPLPLVEIGFTNEPHYLYSR